MNSKMIKRWPYPCHADTPDKISDLSGDAGSRGSSWVAAYPPYNEHLLRDLGGMNLGLAVVLGSAATALERRLTYPALVAYLAFSVPHLVFHAARLEPFAPADAAAQTGALALGVVSLFSEFIGPFNVLHQPLQLSALAWGFWAVSAVAEAYTIVYVLDRGRSERAERPDSLHPGRPQMRRGGPQ